MNQVFQVFGHTRLDETDPDAIMNAQFAMIDSQQCFMIDEGLENEIVSIFEYETINSVK